MFDLSIFIFRRDLRLVDNLGLNECLQKSKSVIPIFILTDVQLDEQLNAYKSERAVQFMMESLEDLNQSLKKYDSQLFLFHGQPEVILANLLRQTETQAVFVNQDYTPYSRKRDSELAKVCMNNNCQFISFEDILLNPIDSVKTGNNTAYQKFTPYFNQAKKLKVNKNLTKLSDSHKFYQKQIKGQFKADLTQFYQTQSDNLVKGGRKEALAHLDLKEFKDYAKTRDYPSLDTTHLSAYNKFGLVSIREVYWAINDQLGKDHPLIRQLYWRDFYYQIAYNYPHVFGSAMREKYNKIAWRSGIKAQNDFKKWMTGQTGFPIIDAGMQQLNQTGYMHNRVRMLVASFLTKVLLIDWQWGEQYFARNLIDYDPAVNNGNWQWVAGTGADAQPYFRVFNPWLQSKRYDKDGLYIKQWLPVLTEVKNEDLHKWKEVYQNYDQIDYPPPMIDYQEAKNKAIEAYKKAVS